MAWLLGGAVSLAAAQPPVASLFPLPRPGADATAAETVAAEIPAATPDTRELSQETPDPGLIALSSKSPVPRPETLLDGHEFRLALVQASIGDWDEARRVASLDGDVAADIIEWQRLRAGKGSFAEYQAFLAKNADWPGLKLLRRRGEASIPVEFSAPEVIAYFKPEPPQTGRGALRLVEAHAIAGDFRASRALLVESWQGLKMTGSEEAAFLAAHAEALAPHHAERLDDALWRNDRDGARRMLTHADKATKAVAEARLALQARAGDADKLWNAVPSAGARDPGLLRDRMEWLVAKKKRAEAADLIIATSKSAKALGRPSAWAKWRRILARQEMRNGNPKRAYALASDHFIDGGSDAADLEWLSGYLALRYRGAPDEALAHFKAFRKEVFTPISLGRAGYWEGRALEAMGQAEAARAAYRDAAQYQTSFYGLLAAEKVEAPMKPAMTGRDATIPWEQAEFAKSSVFTAARLFHQAGEQYEVTRFLRHLAEITDRAELVSLGNFSDTLGDPYIAVRVGKQVAREGAVAHRAYYPLTTLGEDALPVDKSLALAIARRESEFYPTAVSGAGARGLMQLMPGTAKDMARQLGLPYERARLTSDPVYNVRLGSAYLAHLIKQFGDNIVLVSVGYNAGPHRARRWIEANGDPRDPDVDVVDWIEHIPFNETRNYVMRVAESLPVYRARLSGQPQPIRLSEELQAR